MWSGRLGAMTGASGQAIVPTNDNPAVAHERWTTLLACNMIIETLVLATLPSSLSVRLNGWMPIVISTKL